MLTFVVGASLFVGFWTCYICACIADVPLVRALNALADARERAEAADHA